MQCVYSSSHEYRRTLKSLSMMLYNEMTYVVTLSEPHLNSPGVVTKSTETGFAKPHMTEVGCQGKNQTVTIKTRTIIPQQILTPQHPVLVLSKAFAHIVELLQSHCECRPILSGITGTSAQQMGVCRLRSPLSDLNVSLLGSDSDGTTMPNCNKHRSSHHKIFHTK